MRKPQRYEKKKNYTTILKKKKKKKRTSIHSIRLRISQKNER